MSTAILIVIQATVCVVSFFLGMTLATLTVASTRARASRDLRACVIGHIEEREAKAKKAGVDVVWTRHEQELLDAIYDFQVRFDEKTQEITPWIVKKIRNAKNIWGKKTH